MSGGKPRGSESPEGERQRLETERICADVLHELNNVLGTVLAAAHMIDSRADDPGTVRAYVRQIDEAVADGRERLRPLRELVRSPEGTGS